MARPGKLVRDAQAYRRMAAILFVRRNESAVYFEDAIDVTETLAFIDTWNDRAHAKVVSARRRVAHVRCEEIDGARGAARRGEARVSRERDARPVPLGSRSAAARRARGEKESKLDREVRWFLKVPHLLLIVLVRLVRVADFFNLLPRSFIAGDPFFASAFLANLGSVGGAAAFHHLYDYGDIPLFVVLGGRAREEVVAVRGEAVVCFSYDERIEDGFNAIRALATLLREKLERPATFVSPE